MIVNIIYLIALNLDREKTSIKLKSSKNLVRKSSWILLQWKKPRPSTQGHILFVSSGLILFLITRFCFRCSSVVWQNTKGTLPHKIVLDSAINFNSCYVNTVAPDPANRGMILVFWSSNLLYSYLYCGNVFINKNVYSIYFANNKVERCYIFRNVLF